MRERPLTLQCSTGLDVQETEKDGLRPETRPRARGTACHGYRAWSQPFARQHWLSLQARSLGLILIPLNAPLLHKLR